MDTDDPEVTAFKRHWRGTLVLSLGLLASAAAGLGIYEITKPGPALQQLRSEVNTALPGGSSQAEVEDYLAGRHWAYDKLNAKPDEDTFASNQGIVPGTPLIVASFTDNQGDRRVTIYFVLNEEHVLQRTLFSEVRYSP